MNENQNIIENIKLHYQILKENNDGLKKELETFIPILSNLLISYSFLFAGWISLLTQLKYFTHLYLFIIVESLTLLILFVVIFDFSKIRWTDGNNSKKVNDFIKLNFDKQYIFVLDVLAKNYLNANILNEITLQKKYKYRNLIVSFMILFVFIVLIHIMYYFYNVDMYIIFKSYE